MEPRPEDPSPASAGTPNLPLPLERVKRGVGGEGTPHRFRPKTPESASPLGEGEEGAAGEEKTPHRMPWTASASPLGEGEDRHPRGLVLDAHGCSPEAWQDDDGSLRGTEP